jgi:hypothetical protein
MENIHRRKKGMDKFCLCDCSYVRKQIEDEEKRKDVRWKDEKIVPSSTDTEMRTVLKRSYSLFSFNSSDSISNDSSKSSDSDNQFLHGGFFLGQ